MEVFVQHNTVQLNGGTGIVLDKGIVADNTVNTNRDYGIFTNAGTVLSQLREP